MGVGDERTRIAAGEAAVWPADILHSAWTEHSEMRAFVVELAGADDGGVVAGSAREGVLGTGDERPIQRGTGQLRPVDHAEDGAERRRACLAGAA